MTLYNTRPIEKKGHIEIIGLQEPLDVCFVAHDPTAPNGKRIIAWASEVGFDYFTGKSPPRYSVPTILGVVEYGLNIIWLTEAGTCWDLMEWDFREIYK